MQTDIETELERLMARIFQIADSAQARSLRKDDGSAWDSLRHVELIFAVEDAFRVRFSDPDFAGLRSFEEIAHRIAELRQPASSTAPRSMTA